MKYLAWFTSIYDKFFVQFKIQLDVSLPIFHLQMNDAITYVNCLPGTVVCVGFSFTVSQSCLKKVSVNIYINSCKVLFYLFLNLFPFEQFFSDLQFDGDSGRFVNTFSKLVLLSANVCGFAIR